MKPILYLHIHYTHFLPPINLVLSRVLIDNYNSCSLKLMYIAAPGCVCVFLL
jgi:hypothetical protein